MGGQTRQQYKSTVTRLGQHPSAPSSARVLRSSGKHGRDEPSRAGADEEADDEADIGPVAHGH